MNTDPEVKGYRETDPEEKVQIIPAPFILLQIVNTERSPDFQEYIW